MTEEEKLTYIREHYPQKSMKQIATDLGWSAASVIRKRLVQLGISVRRQGGHTPRLPLQTRICLNCQNPFKTKRWRPERFCSKSCGSAYVSKSNPIRNSLSEIQDFRRAHSLEETVEKFEISQTQLSYYGIVGSDRERQLSLPSELTEFQRQVLHGNMMGDGCISYQQFGDNSFRLSQTVERAEYVEALFSVYAPFSMSFVDVTRRMPSRINGKISHDYETWDGRYTKARGFYTVASPLFTRERVRWYKHPDQGRSPKIVPADLRLTWLTAAIWMCDDGSNKTGYGERYCVLHTNCFAVQDVEFLVERLHNDLDVKARIYMNTNKPIIQISGDEWFRFIEGIRPHIPWSCLQKKVINRKRRPHSSDPTVIPSSRRHDTLGDEHAEFLYRKPIESECDE